MTKGQWLKDNPELNPNPAKPAPPFDELTRLYIQEGYSTHQLGRHYGVSQSLARKWLKDHKIPTRTRSQAPSGRPPRDEKHWHWKGDDVKYNALHVWVRSRKGTPSKCEHCGRTDKKKYEWANVSKEYLRDLDDWVRLCTSCHRKFDKI